MISVDRIHITTDAPLGESEARSAGTQLVTEVNTMLAGERSPAPNVRIGELQLNLPRSAVGDRAALTRYARSVAQRILERTPE